jgi:hypothetical protein
MEFKMSDNSRKNWDNLIEQLGVESQMSQEALTRKKEKERAEHLKHLEKYHFKSADEIIKYVYDGNVMLSGDAYIYQDKMKLMPDGLVGHYSLWLSDDDCAVLGEFWKEQTKESFESWVKSIFEYPERLDNGYFPYWHKDVKEDSI